MSDKERVLFIGTKAQAKTVRALPHLLPEAVRGRLTDFCTDLGELEQSLSGSDTPADASTWNVPAVVIYTGRIRQHDAAAVGSNMTINDPAMIEERIRKYGIPIIIQKDVPSYFL